VCWAADGGNYGWDTSPDDFPSGTEGAVDVTASDHPTGIDLAVAWV
jgi:hypothetical protein